MKLLFMKYNKKKILTVMPIGASGNKTLCIKIHENGQIVSDEEIGKIRQLASQMDRIDPGERIQLLKQVLSNFNSVFRTYFTDRIEILQEIPIIPL